MSFFSKKYKSYIGVDIGTSNLKLVELSLKKGKYCLETYGIAEIESDIIRKSSEEVEVRLSKVLAALVKESEAGAKHASSSIPGFSVFNKVMQLPTMEESQIREAIKWEAKKYIPFPIDSLILNWDIINKDKIKKPALKGLFQRKLAQQDGIALEIFLTAVPKKVINRYENIFQKAGLGLEALEPEISSLARTLIKPEDQKKTMAIIDIGSTATEISIIKEGVVCFSRNIDVGGKTITQVLMNSLGVNFERAEQFKKDFGVQLGKNETPDALKEVVEKLIKSINYSFKLYESEDKGPVEKVILSGGSSKLKGLLEYLLDQLKLEVICGNPWHDVFYPAVLEESLPEISMEFAVAVGLAKRGLK